MTLIDHYNAFQRVSKIQGFTANVRSLYFALLGEFNELRFPSELVLESTYLQHLSGIRSTSSFNEARGVLISAGLIKYHKYNSQRQSYALVDTYEKTEVKGCRKSNEPKANLNRSPSESRLGVLTVPKPTETDKEKDRNAEGDAPAPAKTDIGKGAGENAVTVTVDAAEKNASAISLSRNSNEVLQAWRDWGGQTLHMAHSMTLIRYEEALGKDKLIALIEKAGSANQKETLDLRYLSKFVERDAAISASAAKKTNDYDGVDIAPI